MKTTYFKIIELPTNQVLVENDWDAENEEYLVVVTMWLFDVKIRITLGYNTQEKADSAFDTWDEKKCAEQLKNNIQYINKQISC